MSDSYEINGAASPLSPVGAKIFGADAAGNVGWTAAQPAKRPMTIVLLGDSITAGNTDGFFNTTTGPFTWGNALSGHKFDVLYNAGVGSETSTQILARVDDDVIAYQPGYCIVLCGQNDADANTELIKSNITAIYNKLSANGIYAFLCTMTPVPGGTTGKKAQIIEVNRWLRSFCLDKVDAELIDLFAALVDPSSATMAARTNAIRDGVHPSNYGAMLAGMRIADHLSKINGNSRSLAVSAYDAKAICTTSRNHTQNPLMLGTTGTKELNATGDVATNFGLIGYLLTVVGSKEAHPDGYGERQVATISGVTGATDFMRLKFTDPNPLPQAGEKFYMECEVHIESATNLRHLYLYCVNPAYLFGTMSVGSTPSYPLIVPEGGIDLTLRTQTYTFAANETSTIELRLDAYFTAAGGAAVLKVGRMAFVRVD